MVNKLTEYVADRTVRVTYADFGVHNFILSWSGDVLNVVWNNVGDEISSINGHNKDYLLLKKLMTSAELDQLEFILRKHLTTVS
jgi:hypothetical protein